MALTVPDEADAAYGPQSSFDGTDVQVLSLAAAGTCVLAGCAVSAHSTPDLGVDVAAGTVAVLGAPVACAGATVTVAGGGSTDRRDVVYVDGSGVPGVAQGPASSATVAGVTPGGSRDPVKPPVPAGTVAVAEVYVPAGASSVAAGNVTDKRVVQVNAAPPGEIKMYAGAAAPTGYLLCDGSAVARGTYAALFAVVGTTYGAGNGSTTFNLPDLRQRLPMGVNGATNPLGQTGGTFGHSHTAASAGTPSGSVSASTNSSAASISSESGHTHSVPGASLSTATVAHAHAQAGTTGAASAGTAHTHGLAAAGNTGGPSATGGFVGMVSNPQQSNAGSAHTHADTGHVHTASATFSGDALAAHGHGGDDPPFLVVNFIIKA